ncbi:pol-like protein [Apostichopus japonicus]|uniref:Pol-like protein n=1 Tax=Stichopus japonicus TaxID=307972 RepID=A0A2G8LL80_STIJA|nr:pol-like protein [Apostichopus japonicus]
MKNGKSPGSDGLPREFYRTFWAIIGPDIRAVFEDAFQNGLLNQSQRLGMITLLPSLGTPWIPNKRPITLLNVDYKLLAKALCNRLALAMPHLVGDLQTCAVKGHCIQQNLWLMRDLTDFVIERDLPCALVSLDQQKAFDMVDRGFLMNVLETFQLHPNFRKWISVLYEESFSSVIVNGFCSEVFNVERGVRQGCPLSPLLYVLFSESLSRLLERDSRLVPFVVPGGAKVKCAQYADDVTCVVSSLGSFRALSQDLSIFERATGAKLNPEKTKGLRLGSWRYRDLPFGASWSDQNIKINGIWFGYDAPCDVTWNERAEVFESRLETFGTRWLSIWESHRINRFVSPILWYPGAVYPIPRRVLVRLERAIFSLYWSGGTELVKGRYVPKTGEGG